MAGVGGGPPCAEDPAEPVNASLGLFLRPLSRIVVIVKLPELKVPGQSISNWDLMERLKKAIVPIQLEAIRVRESSLETVQFEAELNSRLNMQRVVKCLDGLSLKVSGFVDTLKVRAFESKGDFPSRVDWDKHYYRSAAGRRAGGHPDTLHLAMLPLNWFSDDKTDGPSERMLALVMAAFGSVKAVDIPCCDPLRHRMPHDISGLAGKAYSFGQEVLFEAFVQYNDYQGFTNAMDRLRNQKWMKRMPDGRIFYANVKVDFDHGFHLSEQNVRRREVERERMRKEDNKKVEDERKAKEMEEERIRQEQLEKEKKKEERELKRKIKYELERRRLERKKLLEQRIAEEEKLWEERKKDEARRLLAYVFQRIQARAEREKEEKEEQLKAELREAKEEELPGHEGNEDELRAALLKQREARMRERLKEKLKAKLVSNGVASTAVPRRSHSSSSSSSTATYSSVTSHERNRKNREKKKKKKKKREKEERERGSKRRASHSYSSSGDRKIRKSL